MEILLKGLPTYEPEHLARVFYAKAVLRKTVCTRGELVYVRVGKRYCTVAVRTGGQCVVEKVHLPAQADTVALACNALYALLCKQTNEHPPWGKLTGVRPVNLLRKHIAQQGKDEAKRIFTVDNDVSKTKYSLASDIVHQQAPVLALSRPQSYSLYVSIPFCPSRCTYCSFVSRTIEKEGALVPAYLEAMKQELKLSVEIAERCGLQLETIYIGGGTPTALSLSQLEILLKMVQESVDVAAVREYTVEAGRPDCTDVKKLALLKEYGVTRISINPQSMCDEVLQAVGRRHTACDIVRCVQDARNVGHTNINMDLIAGLPFDNLERFLQTIDTVMGLRPQNITLHTLTLKRASNLVMSKQGMSASAPDQMVEHSYPRLEQAGYKPYYLYRQKNTLSNLENTGWTLPSFECLYNIFIMEEAHSILAVGAGASTKLVHSATGLIQRIFNYKYPAEYVAGIATILQRKKGVETFYGSYVDTKTPSGGGVS